jgi:hypothetical protein
MAVCCAQSLQDLTAAGYGAGSYWKHVRPDMTPVVAVAGNTTRIYPALHDTAANMKRAMSALQYRGCYQRDVQLGLLPEAEDCQDALAALWDIRDAYQPPEGSGLVVDEEGSYFPE